MVAAHSVEVAEAGAEVLAVGGSAADAAVAMGWMACVREVAMTGVGGVGVLVHHDGSSGETREIAFYGRTPAGLRANAFSSHLLPAGRPSFFGWRAVADAANERGALAVGVPAYARGLDLLHTRHGRLAWRDLVAPAARLARDGYLPTEEDTALFAAHETTLRRFPGTAQTYLRDGIPVPEGPYHGSGRPLVQPELADTLDLVARDRSDGIHLGQVADSVSRCVAAGGGVLTSRDLSRSAATQGPGLRGRYRDLEVVTSSGLNGGVTLIHMLNLAERQDLRNVPVGCAQWYHRLAQVIDVAWRERYRLLGDDENLDESIALLADKAYAASPVGLGTDIRADADSAGVDPGGLDTTHLIAADRDGSVVTLTQTLGTAFGSFVLDPDTGVLLYNATAWMNPEPGTPNSVGPWKRQLGHAAPVVLTREGRLVAALGCPGGRRLVTALLQVVVAMVDGGMDVQSAIAVPRIHHEGGPPGSDPAAGSALEVDDRVDSSVAAELSRLGHHLVPRTETATQAFFGRPLGLEVTSDGYLGGADVMRGSLAIGL